MLYHNTIYSMIAYESKNIKRNVERNVKNVRSNGKWM